MLLHDRDNGICGYCKDPVDRDLSWPHPDSPSIDHIVPFSEGGTHSPCNIQLVHFRCNMRKSVANREGRKPDDKPTRYRKTKPMKTSDELRASLDKLVF